MRSDEIYLFDLNTLALVHANDAASKHLTVDHGEVKLHDLTSELAASEIETHLCLLKGGAEEVSFQTCVSRAAGRIPVGVRWLCLSTSGHALVMCTLRDISQRLVLEQAKTEFISVVSHELRTPLTGLYGAIKLGV